MRSTEKLLSAISLLPPIGIGFYSLWGAVTELDGAAAIQAALLGLTLIAGGVMELLRRARQAARCDQDAVLQEALIEMWKQMHQHDRAIDDLRMNVESWLIGEAWLQATGRLIQRKGARHLHLASKE